jgi:S1-C subfamily serine protease
MPVIPAPEAPPQRPAEPKSTGSGFAVSAQGHLPTNRHVVESCARLTARGAGERRAAHLVRADARNDLALLRMEGQAPAHARFREGRGIRAGESVVVLGYPLTGLLTTEAQVTTGAVSALSGPGDDSRLMQLTAPVQPGSSGGPILDHAGNIVGIVAGKLDALSVAAAIGDIPQNVNFGIHASVARAFLKASGVDYDTASAERALDPATIAAEAKAYTVLVECW